MPGYTAVPAQSFTILPSPVGAGFVGVSMQCQDRFLYQYRVLQSYLLLLVLAAVGGRCTKRGYTSKPVQSSAILPSSIGAGC